MDYSAYDEAKVIALKALNCSAEASRIADVESYAATAQAAALIMLAAACDRRMHRG